MSLFGDDSSVDNSTTPAEQKSLFNDETAPAPKSHASLFDDNADGGDSPWSMPTPKKGGRSDLVKTLLPASSVPERYIDAFDVLLESEYKDPSGVISLVGVKQLLESTRLESTQQRRILELVTGGQGRAGGLGRNEINVLIALIGLGQEREELSFDGVDERRGSEYIHRPFPRTYTTSDSITTDLPNPSLPLITQLKSAKVPDDAEQNSPQPQSPPSPAKQPTPQSSPTKSRRLRKDSLENLDSDPWGSPALHKGHTHNVENEETPATNGVTAARPIDTGFGGSTRTTSTFTTNMDDRSSTHTGNENHPSRPQTDGSGAGWGSYDNPGEGFSGGAPSGLGAESFGVSRDEQDMHSGSAIRKSVGGGRTLNRGAEETVAVTLLPDKEGMFLFQHRNYEVKCVRRASSVIRRYSDFVWLLDCLHRRYPFRQLPLLPPKRVAGKMVVLFCKIDANRCMVL